MEQSKDNVSICSKGKVRYRLLHLLIITKQLCSKQWQHYDMLTLESANRSAALLVLRRTRAPGTRARVPTVGGWLPGPSTLIRIEPPQSVFLALRTPKLRCWLRRIEGDFPVFNKQNLEENKTTNLEDIFEVKLSSKCLITSLTTGYPASSSTLSLMGVHIFRQPFPLLSISSYHQALPFIVPKPLILVLEPR